MQQDNNIQSWVVAVDMGYGHQRTAWPLRMMAVGGKVLNADRYDGMSKKDRNFWESTRQFYEFISKFKRIPFLGSLSFRFFDHFQKILSFYPKRDLSRPTFSLKNIFTLIEGGWGKDLIERLSRNPIPLVTTFFTPAFMAEAHGYPGDIYCIICDADIARAWVSLEPWKSKIKYLAPNSWVAQRLKLYGVRSENIFLTGYPLPLENVGSPQMEIAKEDMAHRLLNLDPSGRYRKFYQPLIDRYVGKLPRESDHPLTVMFSIGGAGAQKEIIMNILRSLRYRITKGDVKLIISAGTKPEVYRYFLRRIRVMKLEYLKNNIEILWRDNIKDYFAVFNRYLRKTDILWTKPSELSFYIGLGIPIIIAPPIGSQEDFNRRWLLTMGSISQENPAYTHHWLFDYLQSGRLAEAAMHGFIEAEKRGVYNIMKIISQR